MSTAASPSASEAHPIRRPIIVMGVAGCGKSSVGTRLAEALSLPYQEGDDLHPQANVAKMSAGTPSTTMIAGPGSIVSAKSFPITRQAVSS